MYMCSQVGPFFSPLKSTVSTSAKRGNRLRRVLSGIEKGPGAPVFSTLRTPNTFKTWGITRKQVEYQRI